MAQFSSRYKPIAVFIKNLKIDEFHKVVCYSYGEFHNSVMDGNEFYADLDLVHYPKGFSDFFFAISIFHFSGHHCKEFREIDGSIP